MWLLYYMLVGEAISLPMSLRNKTAQIDGRILSSPTGLRGFRARITEALCGSDRAFPSGEGGTSEASDG